MTSRWVRALDARFYPHTTDHWDDWLFRDLVLRHAEPARAALDLGAGAGILRQMNFRGSFGEVCGIDLDPRVQHNPYLDRAVVGTVTRLPFPAETFDVVFCANVLEHLSDPQRVLREVHRVLRPGGVFLAKTPNKWHYMPVIARLTPNAFHRWFNELRGRRAVDTFPTLYRANSRRDLERLTSAAGFTGARVARYENRPEYLRISVLTYVFGLLYERIVNALPSLEPLRIVLLVEARKTGPAVMDSGGLKPAGL